MYRRANRFGILNKYICCWCTAGESRKIITNLCLYNIYNHIYMQLKEVKFIHDCIVFFIYYTDISF